MRGKRILVTGPTGQVAKPLAVALAKENAVEFQPSDAVLETVTIDTTKQHALIGRTPINWRAGMRRMVEQLFPDLVLADAGGS